MAQLNLVVGDVDGNTSRIVAAAVAARDQHRADVILVPELAVSGYPPEDLLFHSGMRLQVGRSLERLKQEVRGITLIAGYPEYAGTNIYNSAAVIRDGAVIANHRKACLPNYRVFDEKRYFTPGTLPTVVEINGVKAGVLVCEDIWDAEPALKARKAGAKISVTGWVQKVSNLILNINLVARDVATGRIIGAGSVDIRGNTDESWSRGLTYLLRDRLHPSEWR